MKIATGIITLVLMFIVGIQSLAVAAGASLANMKHAEQGGSVGIFGAFLFLVGGAFAFGVPLVAAIIMIVAGIFAVAAGASTPFHDLVIWGVLAFILAGMSLLSFFLGRRRKRRATGIVVTA